MVLFCTKLVEKLKIHQIGVDSMARSAGILLSITSLPSPYGIGTIGKDARKFADFLKKSGQKIWQILPVGPTSYGDSPYQSFSTYAGNPYSIPSPKRAWSPKSSLKALIGAATTPKLIMKKSITADLRF